MANYFALLTNQGAAKLANAAALGIPLKLTAMAVGDGNGQAVTPNPAATKLVNEKRRAPLNALFADPLNASQLVAEQIIPETVGGWWIRELGLYDEAGTLIAVANCPDTYKPLLSEGSGRTQVIRMVLIVSSTSAVELKIDPAVVLASRQFVENLAVTIPVTGQLQAASARNYRFMASGELTLPDTGTVRVIVDHMVPSDGQCLVKEKSGQPIITPRGNDPVIRLASAGKEFVFSKINNVWRVS